MLPIKCTFIWYWQIQRIYLYSLPVFSEDVYSHNGSVKIWVGGLNYLIVHVFLNRKCLTAILTWINLIFVTFLRLKFSCGYSVFLFYELKNKKITWYSRASNPLNINSNKVFKFSGLGAVTKILEYLKTKVS